VSTNPDRSKPARIAALLRQAKEAEDRGRVAEAASLLQEVVRLDPRDRRTLHRLGDLFRIRLNRFGEAAEWYVREARAQEEEGFHGRAIALWRLVLRCDPARVEAHERIGALYVEMGHVADARLHYERAARELKEAGLVREAAVLRAHLAALQPEEAAATPEAAAGAAGPAAPEPAPEPPPDADAIEFAADRLQNGRLFHHYGLHQQARQQLEELLASLQEHVEARQLLVGVCRALGDHEAAAQHLRVATRVMRGQGEAPTAGEAWDPPVEEWVGEPPVEEPAAEDPLAALMGEIRDDVERLVESLRRREEER
jgi:tetratricopeptide (TPR) repeat protein